MSARSEPESLVGCVSLIKQEEIWDALKHFGRDKIRGIDGLSDEVYHRHSHVFVPLIALVITSGLRKPGYISERFTRYAQLASWMWID